MKKITDDLSNYIVYKNGENNNELIVIDIKYQDAMDAYMKKYSSLDKVPSSETIEGYCLMPSGKDGPCKINITSKIKFKVCQLKHTVIKNQKD
jgi:hypothetical protein